LCGINSTLDSKKRRNLPQQTSGMIFTLGESNESIMEDLLLILSITVGTYLCFFGYSIILLRLFFPLKTKEEMERIRIAPVLRKQESAPKPRRRVSLQLTNESRLLA
jgi:hypothetical protein